MIYWDRWSRASPYGQVPNVTLTLVTPPVDTPISVDELRGRARIETEDENDLLIAYIKAATSKVEQDTGIKLMTQTWDVIFDEWKGSWSVLTLPLRPLQSVTHIKTTDSAGVVTTWAASNYLVDASDSRIALADTITWPGDIRLFQAWSIRVVVGHATVALIDPLLVHAVGLLATHYATAGRDAIPADAGYIELINGYTPVA